MVQSGAVIVLTVTGKFHDGGGSSAIMLTVGYRNSCVRSVQHFFWQCRCMMNFFWPKDEVCVLYV